MSDDSYQFCFLWMAVSIWFPAFTILSTAAALFPFTVCGHQSSPPITLANFGENEFSFPEQRFLLYDVNPGEGFNLRRDVYMRVANAVRQLRERGHDFVLVLPPWGKIWHWKRRDVWIPWAELFDLEHLATFVPVIEFTEFLQRNGNSSVDLVLYLQHYAEGWSESEGFVIKYDIRPCQDGQKYYKKVERNWEGPFFGHKIIANGFQCLSFQGQSSTLVDAISELFTKGRSIMIDRAETILHDHFGDIYYWQARKSMKYAKNLQSIGDQFRRENFNNSTDSQIDERSMILGRKNHAADANNFLCAHLRRSDFVWAHKNDIPSIEGAAKQLISLSESLGLKDLFLCTDANMKEIDKLTQILDENGLRVVRFGADREDLSEAAISIIDQLICACARWFIGTHHSTFSLRIHEDREILGLDADSTFNRFCSDGEEKCDQPAKWTIVHG